MSGLIEVWEAILKLHRADGLSLKDHEGCWYRRLDEAWEIGFNCHRQEMPCAFAGGTLTVPPFSVLVVYNEWPAGLIDTTGGEIAGVDGANSDTFVAALKAAAGVGA